MPLYGCEVQHSDAEADYVNKCYLFNSKIAYGVKNASLKYDFTLYTFPMLSFSLKTCTNDTTLTVFHHQHYQRLAYSYLSSNLGPIQKTRLCSSSSLTQV